MTWLLKVLGLPALMNVWFPEGGLGHNPAMSCAGLTILGELYLVLDALFKIAFDPPEYSQRRA